jgi:hypothetical protein
MKRLFLLSLLHFSCTINTKQTTEGDDSTDKNISKNVSVANEDSLILSQVNSSLTFNTYRNARLNFCIDYPKDMLTKQSDSRNDDNIVFKDVSGQSVLQLFKVPAKDENGRNVSITQQVYRRNQTPPPSSRWTGLQNYSQRAGRKFLYYFWLCRGQSTMVESCFIKRRYSKLEH